MLHVYRYNYLQATQHSASLRPRTGQNRMGRKYFRESFVNIGFLQISTLLVFFTSLIILNTISENVPKTRKWTFRCYPIRRVSNILMGILHSTICLLANGWSPKMWETLRATRSAQYTLLYMYEHNEKFKPLKQSMILETKSVLWILFRFRIAFGQFFNWEGSPTQFVMFFVFCRVFTIR